ncbi:MAG TPA: uroporphyrinogen decarboxylase family protein [Planctomycetota bacterium]|nr:uroporphyrinogen decarboxylase family protein [Planctomycetota bacterium]
MIEPKRGSSSGSHRDRFMAVMRGERVESVPFFPDITDWYGARRGEPGKPRPGGAGAFMSDADPVHKSPGSMPEAYRDFTLLDFYRRFDWGLPIHHYGWFRRVYVGGVEREVREQGGERVVRLRTPRGSLVRRELLAADGSWCPVEHFCKEPADLEIVRLAVEATRYEPRYDAVRAAMAEMGDRGVGDLPLDRSPFGKLVHEYMGFEQAAYALFDDAARIEEFLALQEQSDLELVKLAAAGPAPVVIMSDHADENLIAPPHYERYCLPYYRKIVKILHDAGKLVSTHLDGNFRGFFPLLGQTSFDLLDGCTPAPMFNYEVEELAAALPPGMKTYCGVPATLFCQRLPDREILAFGDRILAALGGRCILNVGDILPPNGDIEQVIALGRHLSGKG